MRKIRKEIFRLVIPNILANITIPLVGIVDIAIIGHLSDASSIGGIAIGTLLFDLLYWNFGFLRIGTTGLTAQAYGQKNDLRVTEIFTQTIGIACISTLLIWVLQGVFLSIVMRFIPCTPEVAHFARQYFLIRIWAAPATLALMVFKGWFIGMQNTVAPMICDIIVNVTNMIMSYLLAVYTPLGIIGVAYGTVIAQFTGLITAIIIIGIRYGRLLHKNIRKISLFHEIKDIFQLSINLFIRSICFMAIYIGFTAIASTYGDIQLAVSSIIMKLFMFFSYFIDGFAHAGEALTGRCVGERNEQQLMLYMKILFIWSSFIGLIFTLIYLISGTATIRMMTSDSQVIIAAQPFLAWLILMPLISCPAFMWDGIYIGAAIGNVIRNVMIIAAIGFVVTYLLFQSTIGIHALYLAYFVHLIIRALFLQWKWPHTKKQVFC